MLSLLLLLLDCSAKACNRNTAAVHDRADSVGVLLRILK
jgi:hypothetical protein